MKSRERKALLKANAPFVARAADAPYRVWGADHDAAALEQMKNACALPVAAAGALMPDAHVGYGLPIGGVLATHERGDPVRGRRRHRLPHEDDRARPAAQRR